MTKNLLRAGSLLALAAVAACSVDTMPVTPAMSAASASRALTASGSEEASQVSPILASMNAQLAASGAKVRIAKAELLMKAGTWNGQSSTILLANDRYRGIGMEWVPGDPRRDGRAGVSYAIQSVSPGRPVILTPAGFAYAPRAQVVAQIEEGMQAWRNQSCAAPIQKVDIAAGTDPNFIDDFFRGTSPVNYVQPADIVQGGFETWQWFELLAGPDGDNILGITFTLNFIDEHGNDTDIDKNGKLDIGLAEIYYNPYYAWTSTGEPGFIDFYSVMTHETGHSLGLGHFGKLFVTKHDAANGIQLADIKYAPYAIMNAAYVTGRNEIAGTDHSSFCQIWSHVK